MSPDIPNLVQTSNNLARVEVKDGNISLQCLCRSSLDSEKDDHARSIAAAFALAGLETDYSGQYPGWTPNPSSAIVAIMKNLYEEKYGEAPRVVACHAGLECGILGTNYPEMDMIAPSFSSPMTMALKRMASSILLLACCRLVVLSSLLRIAPRVAWGMP